MKKFSKEEREMNERLIEAGFKLYMTPTKVAQAFGKSRADQGDALMEGCTRWKFGESSNHVYYRGDVARQMALGRID